MTHQPGRSQTDLAAALRDLRARAGLSTYQLAEALDWSQSKITKIENGRTRPSVTDAEAWARACEAAGDEIGRLADLAHSASTEARSWWSAHRGGLAARQREMGETDRAAARIRHFQPAAIPGLLQTPAYARHALTFGDISERGGIDEAVGARMARQAVLADEGKRFAYVLTEGALRWRPHDPGLMEEQAGRLLAAAARPNVALSVIPFAAEPAHVYLNGFAIFDLPGSPLVLVENYTAETFLPDARDIAAYERIFAALEGSALSGPDAVTFIRALIFG